MLRRRQLLSLLAAGFSASITAPALAQAVATGPVPGLIDGGHVIYFRHGATTWSGIDSIDWPRERQRLLSAEGIRQSEVVGDAFRARGLPVGDVLASPFARCRDMAEIAFGRVDERMELIGLLSDRNGRSAREAYLRDLVVNGPTDGTNRIIVSHRSNIDAVAGVRLAEGEAVVLKPDGVGGFERLATIMPDDWVS